MKRHEFNVMLGNAQRNFNEIIDNGHLSDLMVVIFKTHYVEQPPLAIHLVFDDNYLPYKPEEMPFDLITQDLYLEEKPDNVLLTLTETDYNGYNLYEAYHLECIFDEYFGYKKNELMDELEKQLRQKYNKGVKS